MSNQELSSIFEQLCTALEGLEKRISKLEDLITGENDAERN